MGKEKVVVGFDIGGAHLKLARVEDGRVVAAATIATPLWQGLDKLTAALHEAAPFYEGSDLCAFTMTGELADVFASREAGVRGLLDIIRDHFSAVEKRVYAGRAGFVGIEKAADVPADIASANWPTTASMAASLSSPARHTR